MQKTLKVLGLIGMRSGSKGVPDKNIKPLLGKPLVGWIIDAAKNSKHINRVIVSTDSAQYAEIARQLGAEVPVLRPVELAQDHSVDLEYIMHMLEWLKKNEGYEPDIILRLLPTVPMQRAEDLDAIIEALINEPAADSAVVVTEASQHPHKTLKLVNDGRGGKKLVTYFGESGRDVTPAVRQKYEKAYVRGNAIACRTDVVYNTGTLTGDLVRYHIIPQERAVDVDTPLDFFIIEQILKGQLSQT